jgi:hypothetical protein
MTGEAATRGRGAVCSAVMLRYDLDVDVIFAAIDISVLDPAIGELHVPIGVRQIVFVGPSLDFASVAIRPSVGVRSVPNRDGRQSLQSVGAGDRGRKRRRYHRAGRHRRRTDPEWAYVEVDGRCIAWDGPLHRLEDRRPVPALKAVEPRRNRLWWTADPLSRLQQALQFTLCSITPSK